MKTKATLFLMLLAGIVLSQPQINTVAGTGYFGQWGYSGQSATSADIYPIAVAVDSLNSYFIDNSTNTIMKVAYPTNTLVVVGGYIGNQTKNVGYAGDGGPATNAIFNNPQGLAVDDSGNIYVADMGNFRVRKIFASSGVIQTVAGTGVSGFSGDNGLATSAKLGSPYALALDDSNNIYIMDQLNNRVRKVTISSGKITTIIGNGITGFAGDNQRWDSTEFNQPEGIAVDDSNNVYIADRGNQRIRKFTFASQKVKTIAGNGTAGFTGDGAGAILAELNYPCAVSVDDSANIFIVDQQNNRIRKVKPSTGVITTVCGTGVAANTGDSGLPTSASINLPYAVASKNSSGYVWICVNGYRLRRFNHY